MVGSALAGASDAGWDAAGADGLGVAPPPQPARTSTVASATVPLANRAFIIRSPCSAPTAGQALVLMAGAARRGSGSSSSDPSLCGPGIARPWSNGSSSGPSRGSLRRRERSCHLAAIRSNRSRELDTGLSYGTATFGQGQASRRDPRAKLALARASQLAIDGARRSMERHSYRGMEAVLVGPRIRRPKRREVVG